MSECPFNRPLDRHLWAQRLAFGPNGYRPDPEHIDRWRVTCPRCVTKMRTAVVTEHGGGEPIMFSCLEGCPPEKVTDSARAMEEFFIDGQRTPLLPLRHDPVNGWTVKLPLQEFAELLEEAA